MNRQPTCDEDSEVRAPLDLDKPQTAWVFDRKLLAFAALAAFLLLAAIFLFFRSDSRAERSFVVEPASRVDLTVIITATGSVPPTNQVGVSTWSRAKPT
jgi:hypothetical protein